MKTIYRIVALSAVMMMDLTAQQTFEVWTPDKTKYPALSTPTDLDIAPDGSIYMISGEYIKHLSSDGALLHEWGGYGTGNGQFGIPLGLSVTSSGHVFVSDFFYDNVQVFDENGTFISKWGQSGSQDGQLDQPRGIYASSSGGFEFVWVVDSGNNRIQIFSANGGYISQYGSLGSNDGEFDLPLEIDIQGSYAYVVDSNNDRIQKFTTAGAYQDQWAIPVSFQSYVVDVAVDTTGNMFVAGGATGVRKVTPSGIITQWGTLGRDEGELDGVSSIAYDNGYVYLSENSATIGRIQKYDTLGNFIAQYGSMGKSDHRFNLPLGIAVDTQGNVYVDDHHNARIQKYDPNGNHLASWGQEGQGSGEFTYLNSIAVDTNGYIYAVDGTRIQKFNPQGAVVGSWGGGGNANGQFGGNDNQIAVGLNGKIYITDPGNDRIQQFADDGTFLNAWGTFGTANGEFKLIKSIAVDSSGNVYVMDTPSNNRIQKFAMDGTFIASWALPFGDGNAIAFRSDNHLYIATRKTVKHYDASMTFVEEWGSSEFGSIEGYFYEPKGIAVDPSGNIFVSDSYNHRIQVLGVDTDNDGTTDPFDSDDDNDGISDAYETQLGTDPLDANSKPSDIDSDGIPDVLDGDKDGDGIANGVEPAYGLNPNNGADGTADFDGDGFSNALEISIGTNIHNAASKPGWTPIVMDGIVTFAPYKP